MEAIITIFFIGATILMIYELIRIIASIVNKCNNRKSLIEMKYSVKTPEDKHKYPIGLLRKVSEGICQRQYAEIEKLNAERKNTARAIRDITSSAYKDLNIERPWFSTPGGNYDPDRININELYYVFDRLEFEVKQQAGRIYSLEAQIKKMAKVDMQSHDRIRSLNAALARAEGLNKAVEPITKPNK